MQEIIAINKTVIGNDEVNSVDARELHTFLGSKQKFADWIDAKVVNNPFFKESVDFIVFRNIMKNTEETKGGRPRTEYALTLDTAKKVSMAEQTAKGEEVRTYFIQCEKMLKEVVHLDKDSSITLKELIDIKLLTTKYLSEMLNYSEASTLQLVHNVHKEHNISTAYLPQYVENQRVSFSITDLLKKNNINISAKAFNAQLLQKGILEEKERRSRSSKDGVKRFKAIAQAGLKYGHNDVSPHNKNEVQPRYYEDTFLDMFNIVMQGLAA